LTTTKSGQLARHQSVVIGDTYSLTPSMVNSIHVAANRMASSAARLPEANPQALGSMLPSPVTTTWFSASAVTSTWKAGLQPQALQQQFAPGCGGF